MIKLPKERMTVKVKELTFQAFNQFKRGKIMGYVTIDHRYICFNEWTFDQEITQEYLENFAKDYEKSL